MSYAKLQMELFLFGMRGSFRLRQRKEMVVLGIRLIFAFGFWWCSLANCLLGKLKSFMPNLLVFGFNSFGKGVGRRVLCASLVKGDAACISKVVD